MAPDTDTIDPISLAMQLKKEDLFFTQKVFYVSSEYIFVSDYYEESRQTFT